MGGSRAKNAEVGVCRLSASARGWRRPDEGIVGALLFYRRVGTVTGDDDGGAGEREQPLPDRARDRVRGAAPKVRAPDRPAEERVTREHEGRLAGALEKEAERAGRVPGRVQRARLAPPEGERLVARELARGRRRRLVAGAPQPEHLGLHGHVVVEP